MAKELTYKEKKKFLNRFHTFTFPMPPKGKDFTPQQKAAITRQWQKVTPALNRSNNLDPNKWSFIPLNRASSHSFTSGFITTNKGMFYPRPNAKLKKDKSGKYKITVKFGVRRDQFIPLPKSVYENPFTVHEWIESIYKKYGKYYNIALSIKGYRGMNKLLASDFGKYMQDALFYFGAEKGTQNAINGVYLVAISKR